MKRVPPSAGRSWRSNHYLDAAEAIDLLSKKRGQLLEVARLAAHALKVTRDAHELNQWHSILLKHWTDLERTIHVVEGLAFRDDLVLMAVDAQGRQSLDLELRLAANELMNGRIGLDQLFKSASALPVGVR
jgi:hypothetical protein